LVADEGKRPIMPVMGTASVNPCRPLNASTMVAALLRQGRDKAGCKAELSCRTSVGRQLISTGGANLLILLISALVWEAANIAIDRHLGI
jgi:hypothetical protein